MQFTVTGRHMEVTNDVRGYAEKRLTKLPRYYDRVQSIDLVLVKDADNTSAEVIVKADGQSFLAHDSGVDVRALIDLLHDKLERQLTRHKEKARNRKHPEKGPDPYRQLNADEQE